MNQGLPVFSQVMTRIHPQQFARCVARFPPPRALRSFSAWDHFLAMAFAQLTFRESLRDLELCLRAQPHALYRLGFRSRVTRSTVAYANEHRDCRMFAALAEVLMRKARRLYAGDPVGVELVERAFALEASAIDLSLRLFLWANWTGTDAAVKLHALLDLRGNIPAFVALTEGQRHECYLLDELPLEAGSFYVMDRGYQDCAGLHRLHRHGAFFVVRAKCNLGFYVCASRPVERSTGLRCDQTIQLNGLKARAAYSDRLRRIRYVDQELGHSLVLLTNHFVLPAHTITELYRRRWQVELFFKWIKQNLHIRAFLGHTPNAVKTQLWSAVCTYTLVAILKKELGLSQTLHQTLQVLSVHAFEKTPIQQLFSNFDTTNSTASNDNQLIFSGL
jgi:hypothetical protein